MSRLWFLATFSALALPLAQASAPQEKYSIDLEWAGAWQNRNVVQSPNNASATRFALDALTGTGPVAAPRLQVTWPLNTRDDLRLVVAPLRASGQGTLEGTVTFEGQRFEAGTASAHYRFDSWRATWRRSVFESADGVLKLGLTGKIRDAEIRLDQDSRTARRANVGFVPLLHVHAQRQLNERSRLVFEGDGLTSPQGRAFDLSLRYVHDFHRGLSGFAGVRLLDGGADNDTLYNFARFNYLSIGLIYRGF